MADSAFLSRLPVKGAVFQSVGPEDAFKVPLLNDEGKFDPSLISNTATIYEVANAAARLALFAATPGDFCLQADASSIYILKAANPALESSWVRLSTTLDENPILAGYGLVKDEETILVDSTVIASIQQLAAKQDTLESGTNIKTINNQSILGSGNITISGGGNQVNADWNSTSGLSQILNKPTTLAGYGITDAQPLDADLTAIGALTGTSGLLKKTATDIWTLDTATYLTENQTVTVSGDATGSGATSISLTLVNSGVAAGTYNNSATEVRPFTVDAKGRINAIGAAVTITPSWNSITNKPTTLAGYGITDAPSGGTSMVYRVLTTNSANIVLTAFGSQADINNATITFTGGNTVTISNIGSLKLYACTTTYAAGVNTSATFNYVYPEINGQTSLNFTQFPTLAYYNNAGTTSVIQGNTQWNVSNDAGIVTVQRTGLTNSPAANWKIIF